MARPKKKIETRGGAREGAGRKVKGADGKIQKSVYIEPTHEATILASYNAKNLTEALETIAKQIAQSSIDEKK